jgi:hypothetical protein
MRGEDYVIVLRPYLAEDTDKAPDAALLTSLVIRNNPGNPRLLLQHGSVRGDRHYVYPSRREVLLQRLDKRQDEHNIP